MIYFIQIFWHINDLNLFYLENLLYLENNDYKLRKI